MWKINRTILCAQAILCEYDKIKLKKKVALFMQANEIK